LLCVSFPLSHCPLSSCTWPLSFPRLSSVNETNVLKELCGAFCYGYLEQGRYRQASKAWVKSLRLRNCEAGDGRPD
jgi:hypothetical protein